MVIPTPRSNIQQGLSETLCSECATPLQDTQLWGMTFQTCYVWARPSHKLKPCQECLKSHNTSNTIYNATYFEPFFDYCGASLPTTSFPSSTDSPPQPTAPSRRLSLVNRGAELVTEPSQASQTSSLSTRSASSSIFTESSTLPKSTVPSPTPTSTDTVSSEDWVFLSVFGPVFLIIFLSVVIVSLSFKRITLWRQKLKLQEQALKELKERETRVQLHGESVQRAELGGKLEFEMEDKGVTAEVECESWKAELPAREVVGVELAGIEKVRRKPVPARSDKVIDKGETLGVWAGIGIVAR